MYQVPREIRELIEYDLEERDRLKTFAELYTLEAIAKRYNISRNTVWKFSKELKEYEP